MTTEQAIKELKSDRELYGSDIVYAGDGTPEGDLMLALDMGIAALEKQIPEKPLNLCGRYFGKAKGGNCPCCGAQTNSSAYTYCRKCGQKLLWE